MWKRRAGVAPIRLADERGPEELVVAAETALQRRHIDQARKFAERAAAMVQDLADHPRLIAVQIRVARADGKPQDAQTLQAALAGAARADVRAAFALAELANEQNARVEALGWIENALKIDPAHGPSLLMATRILRQLDKQERAYKLLDSACAADPHSVPLRLVLAEMYQEDGRFDEAAAAYHAVLAINPTHAGALAGLFATRQSDTDEVLIERAELVADTVDLPPAPRATLGYALAKTFDRRRDYKRAFHHASAANELMRRLHPHDDAEDQARAARLEAALDQFTGVELQVDEAPAVRPLFIVGMPRSGTTLLEQMLSGHSRVTGLGELSFWPGLVGRWRMGEDGFTMPDVDRAAAAAQRFRDLLKSRGAQQGWAIDKLPDNYRFVSLIAALLPDARFVHCVRDPRDNLVSVFFEHFGPGQTYTTALDSIVARRLDHDRVTAKWRAAYHDRFFSLGYEDVVQQGEPAIRSLAERLELDWEPEVMDHRARSRSVRTPSRHQVREPLYDSSIGRWRDYEPWMRAEFDALGS